MMRNAKITLIVATAILGGTIFTGCDQTSKKEQAAQERYDKAELELKEARVASDIEAEKIATSDEWDAFKTESEIKISEYEIRIKALKAQMRKSGKTFDALYENKIEKLELKIADLKARMDNYDKNQSGWEKFKREFNHDMDEMGKALKDLTVDNKN